MDRIKEVFQERDNETEQEAEKRCAELQTDFIELS